MIFDRIWKNQKKLAVGLNDVILTGLQQGKTVTEIAIALHNRMGQGVKECHRLVRTETMHYLNDTALLRYKDAGVEYVQVWTVLDERTCETCGSYYEKVYPIDKCPHVPLHANCRCTVLPVVDGAEYEDGLDFLSKGGTTEEWKRLKKKEKKDILKIDDKGDLHTDLKAMSDDLAERSLQVSHCLNTLNLPESKCSGVTKIVTAKELPKAVGRTKANGDILLGKDAGIKTIIHEHLHTRSVLNNRTAYRENKWFEENACEMLAEEICNKSGVSYKRTYKNVTEPLRDIVGITSQYIYRIMNSH